MSSIGTGYDLSASQFSPDGRVFQIDYAGKAVENTGTVIGLRGKNGVVLAAEKIIQSKLYEEEAGTRIYTIDTHIGIAVAGLLADGRHIVDTARQEANNYRQQFDRAIPVKALCDRVASYMHAYTLYSAVRPFGVSCILAAWDEVAGPQMYMIEPSGSSYGYFGCASGKGKQPAKTEIEKFNSANMETDELVDHAAKIIYQVHDEVKDKLFKLELSWIGEKTHGKHEYVPDKVYKRANAAGQAAKHDDDDDD